MTQIFYQAVESISISTVSVGLTAATHGAATHATLTVENAPIRFWPNGTAPTASVGHLLNPGDTVELSTHRQLADFRAIAVGGDATIRCSYAARGAI